jgi:hypothetical protein
VGGGGGGGGGRLLLTVVAEWRIMTNRAYAKNNEDGLLCSILWHNRPYRQVQKNYFQSFMQFYELAFWLSKSTTQSLHGWVSNTISAITVNFSHCIIKLMLRLSLTWKSWHKYYNLFDCIYVQAFVADSQTPYTNVSVNSSSAHPPPPGLRSFPNPGVRLLPKFFKPGLGEWRLADYNMADFAGKDTEFSLSSNDNHFLGWSFSTIVFDH